MKSTFLSLLALAGFTIMTTSCAKEEPFIDDASGPTVALSVNTALSAEEVAGSIPTETGDYQNAYLGAYTDLDMIEGVSVFSGESNNAPSVVQVFGADFVDDTGALERFMSGGGLVQGSGPDFKTYGITESEVSGLSIYQSTGNGAIQLANSTINDEIPAEHLINLSQGAENDGSYINPFQSTLADVRGWEVYDAATRTGAILVAAGERFAGAVEGYNVNGTEELRELADKLASNMMSAAAR